MQADYFVRQGADITITESTSDGMATLQIVNSVWRAAQGPYPETYASERVTLYVSLAQLDALCAAIQQFQQERTNVHAPDLDADEIAYSTAYDAARAHDEASAEPHSELDRHTMAAALADAAVAARREEARKARATITAKFDK